jgi:hypothetical protein
LWSSVKARRVRGAIITALLRGIICVRIASWPTDKHPLAFFQAIDDLGLGAGLEADMNDPLFATVFSGHGDSVSFAVLLIFL